MRFVRFGLGFTDGSPKLTELFNCLLTILGCQVKMDGEVALRSFRLFFEQQIWATARTLNNFWTKRSRKVLLFTIKSFRPELRQSFRISTSKGNKL
ncbi:hypothetical protein E6P14_02545 (plasmid) [Haloarcula marismortui ATCC 43049]|uniref:Uncharacterized protein n=2 Tax=Haloarcula marismortui (strain ATCC 43049 / DSM 3752 / JCM 8966 / VKM B-1809) TaxID=272569 RepID=A0A4P8JVG9_HALMA|nr:hypothetical protein E6P14_02545 [Haloarcula marismortui ATCC 43049]